MIDLIEVLMYSKMLHKLEIERHGYRLSYRMKDTL